MTRLFLIGLVAATMSGLWATDAMAQADAGAKMRGQMNFWGSSQRTSGDRFYFDSARADGYRSFSYEPLRITAGDTVVVKGDDIKLMRGTNVVGAAPNGLKFKVGQVINGWLKADVEVNGQNLSGWIWHNNVALVEHAASPVPQAAGDRAQAPQYRRFSYEPAQAGSYGTSVNRQPTWLYQKADPRRYRP